MVNKNPQFCGLITARGGSKGIPGKNIRPLAGKPLIAWTIETALACPSLERVIVSTDDPEIARISRIWGAETPFLRPAEFAQDHSPHIQVILHALDWFRRENEASPEYLVLLQPTSPLRAVEDVEQAISLAKSRRADGVVSVMETHAHPNLTCWTSDDQKLTPVGADRLAGGNRQGFRRAMFVNGAVYVNRVASLLKDKTFYPAEMYGSEMPVERSWQIDSEFDWQIVEHLLQSHRRAA